MYSDWTNQLEHLTRYFLAFGFLMVFVPKLVFRRADGGLAERIMIRFMLMAVLLILLGYVLVLLRLFEVLAIVPALLVAIFRRPILDLLRYGKIRREADASAPGWVIRTLDWLEGKYDLRAAWRQTVRRKWQSWREEAVDRFRDWRSLFETVLLLFVLGLSAWIRFQDAIVSAAPAMSDGYVTLAWMKYIDQRILFHDGIYPQGFHIWMAYLFKFASVDPLYVLKYTGPLNAVLFIVGLYLAVSRWSGSRLGGIMAALLFGLLGDWVVGASALERQAATNSQEFAFVFIFPTLLLLQRWLRDRDKSALAGGIAGMMLTGLIHTLAYVYLGIGVALLLLIYVPLTVKERFRSLRRVIGGGLLSVAASTVPLGIGMLLGRSLHSSSAEFAVAQNTNHFIPELWPIDYIGLAAIGVIGLWLLTRLRRLRAHTGPLFIALFAAVTFLIYYGGSLFEFPGSIVIAARSSELWGMALTAVIGTACGIVFRAMEVRRWVGTVQWLAVAGVLVVVLRIAPPEPIVPYKMEWDSGVEQYLRISESFLPRTWHLVSPSREGHALVLGKGYPMDLTLFLDTYDPDKWPLTKNGEQEPDRGMSHNVFLYHQKEVFRVDESNSIYPLLEEDYEQRELDKARMADWIARHRHVNPDIRIWYEDDHLIIYYLHRPVDRQEVYEQIWGEGEQ